MLVQLRLQDPAASRSIGSTKNDELMRKLRGWFDESDSFCQTAYPEMFVDFDYADGRQLSEADLRTLARRKQPDTTVNKVKTATELVMGIWDRTKVEFVLLPRGDGDALADSVEGMNDATAYVRDSNRTRRLLRRAMYYQSAGGLGWIFAGANPDPTKEEVMHKWVDFRDVRPDPLFAEPDYEDAKYLWHLQWYDAEDAARLHPGKAKQILTAGGKTPWTNYDNAMQGRHESWDDYPGVDEMDGGETYGWRSNEYCDQTRNRVMLAECWYYVPDRGRFVKNTATGETFEIPKNDDEIDPQLRRALTMAHNDPNTPLSVVEGAVRRCRHALVCGPHLIFDEPSPYDHNLIPFVPFIGWRDFRTGEFSGIIRQIRKPQDAYNRAFIKLLHGLATRQVWYERGAADPGQLKGKASDPSANIEVAKGALQNKRIQIQDNLNDAKMHMAVMQAVNAIMGDMSGGLELSGQETNADSGRAIALRQEQGHSTLSTLFENFFDSQQRLEMMTIALVQQFWKGPKWVRTTGSTQGAARSKMLNQRLPDGKIANRIQGITFDIVMDKQAARSSVRQMFADRLMDLMQRMPPQWIPAFLGVVVDMYDVPDKARIKALADQLIQQMGVIDPGAGAGQGAMGAGQLPTNVDAQGNNNNQLGAASAPAELAKTA